MISKSSPRASPLGTNAGPHPTTCSAGKPQAKQPTQPHASENRLPKVILNSQPPQNIAFDIALHTRGIRPSSTHQRVGTSPSYTGPWINLTHQGAEARSKRNYDPAACGEERPKTQEVKRQNET